MIEFNHTIEIGGHRLNVSVKADGNCYTHNYGADADGNRGEMRDECDELHVEIFDGGGRDISDKLLEKYESEWETIDQLAYEKVLMNYQEREQ